MTLKEERQLISHFIYQTQIFNRELSMLMWYNKIINPILILQSPTKYTALPHEQKSSDLGGTKIQVGTVTWSWISLGQQFRTER